jgi:hypothetical protein
MDRDRTSLVCTSPAKGPGKPKTNSFLAAVSEPETKIVNGSYMSLWVNRNAVP